MIDSTAVHTFLRQLQEDISLQLLEMDASLQMRSDNWQRASGGGGESRVFTGGSIFEKAGVNFSSVQGDTLPPSATKTRPRLAGQPFMATGVSVVIHPSSPYVPTTHMNVRFFTTRADPQIWWFGGGFDLTPYYPFREDARSWHQAAKDACDPFGPTLYPEFKQNCDQYFYLPHRDETRGIGGLFFDDFDRSGFSNSFALTQSIGNSFFPAYRSIVERRKDTPYGEPEKKFQLYRRGRYVEFNLLYDRGTLFGLQSGGRTESILMSLPPQVCWEYNWTPAPGSAEAELYDTYLKPQDWLG